MTTEADTVSILIVDDKPEKLLALEALLEDLGQEIVRASSGREALREVLRREFAVILLDINMPGMDGFETATLIRQHRSFKHTPIIFLSAHADDIYLEKSYSLGAVDYIPTPVIPAVLRSKVAVFTELAAKTEQIKRQAESLKRRALQLHKLTKASLQINSATSLDAMLRAISEAARDIAEAHAALTVTTLDQPAGRPCGALSLADPQAPHACFSMSRPTDGLFDFVCRRNVPLRVARAELALHPEWLDGAEKRAGEPTMPGWMAVPLTEVNGRNMGAIQLSDKASGDFTPDDESIIAQLGQLASIAIQNYMHAEAREANRLKDEFLATLSHELRTPLNAILGWTGILRSGPLEQADADRGLEVIERNVYAQTKLIEELLDISRISSGKLVIERQRVSLARVVEAAVDALRPAAQSKKITLSLALGGHETDVEGDPDRLAQVTNNLLVNAIKFTPPGGHVTVSLAEGEDGLVELRVADDGDGITQDFMPFVFDRFRQADSTSRRARGGLGIGLAVVRHVIELHGGTVHAESDGKELGSVFIVRLHAAADALAERPSASPPLPPEASPGPRCLEGVHVLLVEDDADGQEMLRELLVLHHAEVTAVSSAAEAIVALGRVTPDVIVSDISMPGEDGYELMRRVRRRAPGEGGEVPAMALTAYARSEDQAMALQAGFQVHATKPIQPDVFIRAVAALSGSRPRKGRLVAVKTG